MPISNLRHMGGAEPGGGGALASGAGRARPRERPGDDRGGSVSAALCRLPRRPGTWRWPGGGRRYAPRLADLTGLARQHHGVFPSEEVAAFIDGTRDVLAHGPRAMPVWGMLLHSRETIRKIVDYLRELQEP